MRYYNKRQIGEGSYATIYKIQSGENRVGIREGETLVAKVALQSHDGIYFIKNELKSYKKIHSHDGCINIIRFLGSIEEVNAPTILLEYASQGDLHSWLHDYRENYADIGSFMWKFFGAMLNALVFLKEKCKLIHRDIKPDNVLMEKGIFKLSDFGLATKISDRPTDTRGTPMWIPPEGYLCMLQTDKADIWEVFITGLKIWDYRNFNMNVDTDYWNPRNSFEYYSRSIKTPPSTQLGNYDKFMRNVLPYIGVGDQSARLDAVQFLALFEGRMSFEDLPPINMKNHDSFIKAAIAPATQLYGFRRTIVQEHHLDMRLVDPTQTMRPLPHHTAQSRRLETANIANQHQNSHSRPIPHQATPTQNSFEQRAQQITSTYFNNLQPPARVRNTVDYNQYNQRQAVQSQDPYVQNPQPATSLYPQSTPYPYRANTTIPEPPKVSYSQYENPKLSTWNEYSSGDGGESSLTQEFSAISISNETEYRESESSRIRSTRPKKSRDINKAWDKGGIVRTKDKKYIEIKQ